jgi:hypothetical protein
MKGTAVVGRLTRDHNRIFVYPFAFHGADGRVRNFFLDSKSAAPEPASAQFDTDESSDETMEPEEDGALPSSTILSEIWDSLVAITESGGVQIVEKQAPRLALLSKSCAASGLDLLAASLNSTVKGGCSPSRIVALSYITYLHMQRS